MRIKSFYANTVEGAVALARRELGPEAMLVESRKAPLEARHLGEYEVVCALVPEAEAAQPAAGEDFSAHDARLAAELSEMRRQLDVMGKTLARSVWGGSHSSRPEMSEWHARLMAADVEGELVHQILDAAYRRGTADTSDLENRVTAEIEERALVNPVLSAPGPDGPHAAVLVGPPGAGKTTMIAKLAVARGIAARRPVVLLSMDDARVAGADQLRSYATILGAGFQALESVGALALALEEHRGKQLVLIDTPGYSPRDMDRAMDLARFLASRPSVATHLVLTASMKSADLIHVVERFEMFRPSSLMFTRVDETSSFGTAFSVSTRLGKPVSFLGTGQNIPEDVEPATSARMLNLLWPQALSPARLAA